MAISTDELELSITVIEKFQQENPKTWAHILHNWDVIKSALDSGALTTDLTALQDQLTALQAQVDAIQLTPGPQGGPGPEGPEGSEGPQGPQGIQGPDGILGLPNGDGLAGYVLTHGPGDYGDLYWALPDTLVTVYAPAQTGDLIPVNELTADEALLPEFLLDDDGRVMLVPVA